MLVAQIRVKRIELESDCLETTSLCRLDKSALDVAVLGETFGKRNTRLERITNRRWSRAVWYTDHNITDGTRCLNSQHLSKFLTYRLNQSATQQRVWSRKVDVFKHTECTPRERGASREAGVNSLTIDTDQLTGLYLALKMRGHGEKRTRLGGDTVARSTLTGGWNASHAQRSHAVGITSRIETIGSEHNDGIGGITQTHKLTDAIHKAATVLTARRRRTNQL
mmetsp:Transcript_5726/g.14544  ORF Transcript_5726/g.14544 Transcript_5726/m.14544 type:complete len:223 (+) Transcript_5726:4874-5542(+)